MTSCQNTSSAQGYAAAGTLNSLRAARVQRVTPRHGGCGAPAPVTKRSLGSQCAAAHALHTVTVEEPRPLPRQDGVCSALLLGVERTWRTRRCCGGWRGWRRCRPR